VLQLNWSVGAICFYWPDAFLMPNKAHQVGKDASVICFIQLLSVVVFFHQEMQNTLQSITLLHIALH